MNPVSFTACLTSMCFYYVAEKSPLFSDLESGLNTSLHSDFISEIHNFSTSFSKLGYASIKSGEL